MKTQLDFRIAATLAAFAATFTLFQSIACVAFPALDVLTAASEIGAAAGHWLA